MVTDGTGLSAQQWPPPSQLQVVDHTSRLISVESLNRPADKQWMFSPVYTSVTILSRCKHPESWAGVNSCKDSLVSRELFNLKILSDEDRWLKGVGVTGCQNLCPCCVLIHLYHDTHGVLLVSQMSMDLIVLMTKQARKPQSNACSKIRPTHSHTHRGKV